MKILRSCKIIWSCYVWSRVRSPQGEKTILFYLLSFANLTFRKFQIILGKKRISPSSLRYSQRQWIITQPPKIRMTVQFSLEDTSVRNSIVTCMFYALVSCAILMQHLRNSNSPTWTSMSQFYSSQMYPLMPYDVIRIVGGTIHLRWLYVSVKRSFSSLEKCIKSKADRVGGWFQKELL